MYFRVIRTKRTTNKKLTRRSRIGELVEGVRELRAVAVRLEVRQSLRLVVEDLVAADAVHRIREERTTTRPTIAGGLVRRQLHGGELLLAVGAGAGLKRGTLVARVVRLPVARWTAVLEVRVAAAHRVAARGDRAAARLLREASAFNTPERTCEGGLREELLEKSELNVFDDVLVVYVYDMIVDMTQERTSINHWTTE